MSKLDPKQARKLSVALDNFYESFESLLAKRASETRGDIGPQGEQGEPGAQGIPGEPGEQGEPT
jgi:hypothetical protein